MKKLLVTTFLSATLISCSNEQVSMEEGSCFSNGVSTYQWTMVTTWPKNFPGLGMGPENFSKYVDEMTCGRMKIKVYGGRNISVSPEYEDCRRIAIEKGISLQEVYRVLGTETDRLVLSD